MPSTSRGGGGSPAKSTRRSSKRRTSRPRLGSALTLGSSASAPAWMSTHARFQVGEGLEAPGAPAFSDTIAAQARARGRRERLMPSAKTCANGGSASTLRKPPRVHPSATRRPRSPGHDRLRSRPTAPQPVGVDDGHADERHALFVREGSDLVRVLVSRGPHPSRKQLHRASGTRTLAVASSRPRTALRSTTVRSLVQTRASRYSRCTYGESRRQTTTSRAAAQAAR